MTTLLRELPERDAHANLYEITMFLLGFLDDPSVWPALMIRWELALLDELGFGLDLAACAAGSGSEDLCFVSPKSGRAVSREAGTPYADRLLALPAFLRPGRRGDVTEADLVDGFALTGYFLASRIFAAQGGELPEPVRRMRGLCSPWPTAAAL